MSNQIDIFQMMNRTEEKKEKPKTLRLFEAFSGYGSQSLALDLYNIPYKHVGIAEINKYAIQVHKSLHGQVKNYGDISKVKENELPDMDLFTYSFPCQDISNAGKKRGLEKGSGTRSSLLWECERVIRAKKPVYLMMENVKALVQGDNLKSFGQWLTVLEELGYINYWKVVNAKWCGVPQNRDRVFCVSILKEYDDESFYFEQDFDNGLRLKDMLEVEVDDKYYLSDKIIQGFLRKNEKDYTGYKFEPRDGNDIACCDTARYYKMGASDNYIKVKTATKKGYDEARPGDSIDLERPDSPTRRARVGKGIAQTLTTSCAQAVVEPSIHQVGNLNTEGSFGGNPQVGRIYDPKGIAPTLSTCGGGNQEPKILQDIKIRKLTPRECFRLMGLNDSQIDKIQTLGISDTQQYKLAGNSIVVQQMAFLKNLI